MRLKQFVIAVDQMVNTLLGSGWADETISAWAWRTQDKNPKLWKIIDGIFFFDPFHCYHSFKNEKERAQLPIEYR